MAAPQNKKKNRQVEHLEAVGQRFYIFCEGEQTEPQYFRGFEKAIKSNPVYKNLVHVHVEGVGAETLNRQQNDVVYKVAWSNQCIEYWFILHFAYYTSDNDRKDYRKFLHSKFKELG